MRSNGVMAIFLLFTLLVLIPVLYLKRGFPAERVPSSSGISISLYARQEGRVYRLDFEDYLIGVVAAEMPAEFGVEALKAQAVAARTLAIRRLPRFGGRGCQHTRGADFCDDPGENQAWLSNDELYRKWGRSEFETYYRKIRRAVQETRGVVMVYNNRLIDAVFHSTCGVGTAAAREIWHYDIPYLQNESCGFDQESTRLKTSYHFSWSRLAQLFGFPETTVRRLTVGDRFSDGRISWIAMGGNRVTNEDFRIKLGLNSTYFNWKRSGDGIQLTTVGYGHGVGLCQYGAGGMAKQGWKYGRILSHYYRGIQFRRIRY
ncbi:MAG TPA: stage II sporulation protein D [Bacillota bacterium]